MLKKSCVKRGSKKKNIFKIGFTKGFMKLYSIKHTNSKNRLFIEGFKW